jgi:hypothetical protein
VIAILVGIIGTVVAGVHQAGGISITVMKVVDIGCITNPNCRRRDTGIMTIIGVKGLPLPLRAGMKGRLQDGAKGHLRDVGNAVENLRTG